jgi:hypothetical protein
MRLKFCARKAFSVFSERALIFDEHCFFEGIISTYAALAYRSSWNSYENSLPSRPIVRAMECENEPEPVPANQERVRRKMHRQP